MSPQQKICGAKTAYDLARALLALMGVRDAEHAYAAIPDMPPRTVRRIFECGAVLGDAVLMGYGVRDLKEEGAVDVSAQSDAITHKDSISKEVVEELTSKAKRANVNPRSAVSAVLRYGNPLERVTKVLDDIVLLASRAKNPSGLFVFCMRHGTDVKLPEEAPPPTEPQRPPLSVGEWVKWNLEWMKVMVISGISVLLSPTGDVLDSYKVPESNLLHLPRANSHPAG